MLVECAGDDDSVRAVARVLKTEMTAAFVGVFPDHPPEKLAEPTAGPTWADQTPVADRAS